MPRTKKDAVPALAPDAAPAEPQRRSKRCAAHKPDAAQKAEALAAPQALDEALDETLAEVLAEAPSSADDALLPSDDVEILSAFFKALSDPSRLNIVCVLLKYRQLSVGDIATKVNMSVSAVSHQLAILRMRKLVMVKRDGVKNYYALCDNHVAQVIETAIEHINE